MGTSTLSEAILFAFCSQRGASLGLVMADDEEGASDIFKMNEVFYEELARNHPSLTPLRSRSDERRMEFPAKRSSIRIETAKNKRAGRKYTYRYAHLTECAFYPNFSTLMAGFLPSVPDQPETIIILETTANGLGDFHKFWMEKRRLAEEGTTDWVPVFIPWKEQAEYQRPFYDAVTRARFEACLTVDEKLIMNLHKLNLEQMNWRRHQIADVYNGDQEKFEVEYPLSDREAFKSTSRAVFPPRLVEPQRVHLLVAPKFRGELEIVDRRSVPVPDPKGFLKIYKEVQPEWQYVIGADACESAISHDEACIQVLARPSWEQVAHLHGHIAPDDLAVKLFALGRYYNFALIAPERNGPGAVTVQKLIDLFYPNLCKTTKLAFNDSGHMGETEEIGFHTNAKTKPLIIDKLSSSLRDLLLVIHDEKTLDEISTYVVTGQTEDGYTKMAAEEGHRDDCVIALAIATWYCHQIKPMQKSQEITQTSYMSNTRSGYG